jgi:hypothetical protein
MPNRKRYGIFLSHAAEDKEFALGLKALLKKAVKPRRLEHLVFCSSDVGDIGGGEDWYPKIIAALRSSQLCLALLTPNSIHSPWILYESGGAYAVFQRAPTSRRLIPVIARGLTSSSVPSPFKKLQIRNLADSKEAYALISEIRVLLGRPMSLNAANVGNLVSLAAPDGRRWDTVEPTLVAKASDSSPFNVEHVLRIAKRRVVVIGQNLQWLAKSENCHDAIVKFLRKRRGQRIYILINDFRNGKAVSAWSNVNPSIDRDGYCYRTHVREATNKFIELKKRCLRERANGFTLHVRDLVPFGATIMDPEDSDGVIALQPLVNHGQKASERPQFLISKRNNPDIFEYYWRCLNELVRHGKQR